MTSSRRSGRSARASSAEGKAEIAVERTLVIFVEKDRGHTIEARVLEDHAHEHALGHDLDARRRRPRRLETDLEADRLPDRFTQRRRHALGRGPRREPSRLQQHDGPALGPWLVEQRQRQSRRLAGARRRDDDGLGAVAQRIEDARQHIVDRQRDLVDGQRDLIGVDHCRGMSRRGGKVKSPAAAARTPIDSEAGRRIFVDAANREP